MKFLGLFLIHCVFTKKILGVQKFVKTWTGKNRGFPEHCAVQWPIIPIKNLTSLFPLIFLPKHICVYALGRIKWILGIIWPWNQHFNLKNQRNWKKQVWMLNFLLGIICILLHWWKKITLVSILFKIQKAKWYRRIKSSTSKPSSRKSFRSPATPVTPWHVSIILCPVLC